MKKIALTLFAIQIILISHAQEFAVTMESENGRVLAKVAEDYMAKKEGKIIPFIQVNESNGTMNCYFGLINAWWQVEQNPPSYYFISKSGLPVLVYTGFESNLKPSKAFMDDLKRLCIKFIWGEEVIANIHFQTWYYKLRKGKVIKLRKRVSPKRVPIIIM